MTTTTTGMRQSVILSLVDLVLGENFNPLTHYNPRATFLTTFLVKFYFVRGVVLYCLSQYSGSIRDFRIVLRMDWRHRGAAAWIAKAERANSKTARG
ncbi:hypothetical protein [Microvirga sp. CF3016]|uniref:hypothetical protein n=1 Tax=Microvirga sp. CF3016 TaxID=3110181 RepID=UPI002E7A66AE|nr:hypothetical protein [Microvirga sp. CF3016]MEE1612869.1 hypothetical protein [Microvirga sp. CF3016]